ncbi:hypothetical protein [Luteolibacter sp. LG18]|uniref:hypothetical protein n=1 Tax=Luteolibacter sp. LG18 TaxID=2819286 RepID=UPI002B30305E|nr:hypothetical protein llg_41850 [Luteolibacter sp. LG18]
MKAHFLPLPARRRRRGFSLIIVLTMMILLSILALGLLSLASISLRTSAASADMATARANARLAVMIAVGELQKSLGPDQRVTAPADLKLPAAASPKWVGVYGNQVKADYSQAPGALPAKTCDPVLLNWLVSGNEASSFTASTDTTSFGQITQPPSAIRFAPDAGVSNLTGSGDLGIGGSKAALLVGGGSTNVSSAAADYVAAPIVDLADASSATPRGGYAWWVGDEGIKARVDLRDNHRQQTANSEVEKAKAYSLVTSQRSGIEMMRRDASPDGKIGDSYDPASLALPKVVTTRQLPLLDAGLADANVLKYRFHDVTAWSRSVIADSYAGGLKQDVSAIINSGSGPSDSDPLFTPQSSGEFGLPTWGHVRSWAKRTVPLSTTLAAMPASGVQPYTPTQSRFGPVVMCASLAVGLAQDSPGVLRVKLYPMVVLWNPYSVTIPEKDFEIGFGVRRGGSGLINLELSKASSPGTFSSIGSFSLTGADAGLTSGSSSTAFFRFVVKGSEIPAGESHLYLADDGGGGTTPYAAGSSRLVRAPDTQPIGHATRCFNTTRTFNYDPLQYPAGSLFRFNGAVVIGDLTAGDRFEVVLTKPGELATGFSATTPVYQALLDQGLGNYNYGTAAGKSLASLTTLSSQPYWGIRSVLIMRGNGAINSQWGIIGAMNQPGQAKGQQANRWLASQNPLAPYVKRTAVEKTCQRGVFSHGCIYSSEYEGNSTNIVRMYSGITSIGGAGQAHLAGVGAEESTRSPGIILDVLPPTPSSSSAPLLMSLGQLQHAQLSAYVFSPTYTFGNSAAAVGIPRLQQMVPVQVARPGNSPTNYEDPLYDLPWHLNRALWDRYFVSATPATISQAEIDAGRVLPNARMTYYTGGEHPTPATVQSSSANAIVEAAAHLMVNGGFNINSTSVDAWRAVLTGTNKLTVPAELANPTYQTTPLNAPIARFSRDVRVSDASDAKGTTNMWGSSGSYNNLYRGNRELALFRESSSGESPADAQARLHRVAQNLAEKIVAEIRLRGPFLSVSDFVNRRLVADDSSNATPPTSSSSEKSATGIRGALQAAIDKTATTADPVNKASLFGGIDLMSTGAHLNCAIPSWYKEHFAGCPLSEAATGPASSNDAGAPKSLTQGDLLSTLGPQLSARSDTFSVRGYGEARSSDGKTVTARAWCEVVVQRVPDFVSPSDAASVAPKNLSDSLNKTFGRRFELVSFRWLSPKEV